MLGESISPESYVEVVVPPLGEGFLYSLPKSLDKQVYVGSKLEVPLGRRQALGYALRFPTGPPEHSTYSIKPISRLLFTSPCFHSGTLRFYQWLADYYCVPLGKVIETAVPEPMPPKIEKQWFAKAEADLPLLRGVKQQELFQFIKKYGENGVSHKLLLKHYPRSSATIKRLLELDLLVLKEQEEDSTSYLEPPITDREPWAFTLSEKQIIALRAVQDSLHTKDYASYLLHGVTGSGKTEVYIEAALTALEQGGSVMVLVPEIALTPQLVDRFRARLDLPIAVMHSSIPKRKRWECWRALLEKKCRIVLGARSTIFVPIQNLSLIIVDEEHDSSYKQNDGLRYNARDLALVRGSLEKATVILGSATPAVETFYNASIKKIGYLRLKERPFKNERLSYEIVDLNKIRRKEMASPNISPVLHNEIQETLIREEQVFLLYNRRGFARYLQCRACGEVVFCPNCSVPLTFHQQGNKLLCHYCSYSATPSRYCPTCSDHPHHEKEPILEQRGSGTQKILEELQELFPHASIARLDRDSADKLYNLESILEQVRSKEIQILAGTQMIAKGHDLPGVTLVGVVDCDVGLHMPDFRAAERIFQLLTQAGGRAGRRELPGRVVLQTRVPTHPSVVLTTQENFHEFAKRELTLRKKLNYPPFAKLVRIVCSAEAQEIPLQYLSSIRRITDEWCKANELSVECLGPATAPIEKVKALYRAHLILRATKSSDIRTIVTVLKKNISPPKSIRLTYDIDPQDML